jgi:hypothetical protein
MPRSARDHADDRARQAEHDVVMSSSADRAELVQLVTFLMSADGTEAEQDAALRELEARVLHPRLSSLIFWPKAEG